jgi:CRP/FNR family transcriptional regulator, cyclic AMP receptor protein
MKVTINKEKIAQLLLTPNALITLSKEDALLLVGYMLLARFEQGSVIFQPDHQEVGGDYMLLVLDGDILVESHSTGDGSTVINILGAGHLIGEMALLDGEPRSATCTAQTVVEVAMLSRGDFARLMHEHPPIAARFCLAIAKKLADRVRQGNQKLLMLSQMHKAMQLELDAQVQKRSNRYTNEIKNK